MIAAFFHVAAAFFGSDVLRVRLLAWPGAYFSNYANTINDDDYSKDGPPTHKFVN